MSDILLHVKNLNITLKRDTHDLNIVSNLSFDISRSMVFGLVGESGCGKSLTALSILRLLPQNMTLTGEIVFDGRDIMGLNEKQIRAIRGNEIGMIFQEPMTSLNPVLTVGYQIAEVLITHKGMQKKEALDYSVELLKAVKIPSPELRARDYPHQLSGGMRQRVMIAIAIACKPKLLIADEPTTALDVTIQAQILSLLRELREQYGLSMLFISHDMAVVSETVDYAGIMYTGRLMEVGNVDELIKKPLHPYTKGLLNSLPVKKGQPLVPIKGVVPPPHLLAKGCKFSNRCPIADRDCEIEEPELEEKLSGHFVRCFKV
ncbi:MAG: ABC transporter ATP-binding protein [Thermodesulfovibrionales bacterium]|nr:ABC transporter ATP-binding protein [Thermodesulfovibrionales bacterium]